MQPLEYLLVHTFTGTDLDAKDFAQRESDLERDWYEHRSPEAEAERYMDQLDAMESWEAEQDPYVVNGVSRNDF